MNFLQRYWILEISLAVIAAGGLGLAAYNTFVTPEPSVAEASGTALVVEAAPAADSATQVTIVPREGMQAAGEEGFESEEEIFEEDGSDEDAEYDEEEYEEGEEEWFAFYDIAAQIIGLEFDALEAELLSGRSLADIAAENGVDAQELIDELVWQELAFIDGQVEKGLLPADEAAEWQEEVRTWTRFWVNNAYREPDVVAAEVIGLDIEELWEALETGQTVQSLAESRNIAPQTVIDAVVAAEAEWVEKMVAAEMIDAEEQSDILAETNEWITRLVTLPLNEWEVEDEE